MAKEGYQDAEYSSTIDETGLYCLPCYRAEDQKEDAVGFCRDCSEYLCNICYKVHCRNKHTAHHVLLDKHHMPKSMITTSHPRPASSNALCTKHTSKPTEFYCSDHEVVLCSICSTVDHRQCLIEYIPDYAASYLDSEHGRSKLKRIEAVLQSSYRVKDSIQEQLEYAETNALQAIEDLDKQRDKILTWIDKEFDGLKNSVVKFQNERRTKADEMMEKCEAIRTNVRALDSNVKDIKSCNSNRDESFIQLIHSQINLDIYETKLKELESTKLNTEIRFIHMFYLSDMSKENSFLGRIIVGSLKEITKATKIREMNVKADKDETQCDITGIETLSDSILALADWTNKSVKTVNTISCEILNIQQLFSCPGDLTVVPDNKLAVTLCTGQAIQYLSTDGGLAVGDKILCMAYPHGIEYHNGQLVVSFAYPTNKVEILSLTGDVIRSFSHGLGYLLYVTVSNHSHILISDCLNHRILIMDCREGDCDIYTDPNLKDPLGIAACDDGKFVICSRVTNSVHLVSEKFKKITTLLNEKDGVKKPRACCYDKNKGLLYVGFVTGTDHDNNIGVYQLM